MQPKNISFPTDAKLLHAAIKGLNRLASKHGVRLRQSYVRVAKRAAMMAGRYAHAKQFNRHRRELRILRTRLGRLIRDIGRKIAGQDSLEAAFALPLARASQSTKSEIRLGTMHRSKGLEFAAVEIVDLNHGLIPPRRVLENAADPAIRRGVVDASKSLLHVSATRGKRDCLSRRPGFQVISSLIWNLPWLPNNVRGIEIPPTIRSIGASYGEAIDRVRQFQI